MDEISFDMVIGIILMWMTALLVLAENEWFKGFLERKKIDRKKWELDLASGAYIAIVLFACSGLLVVILLLHVFMH